MEVVAKKHMLLKKLFNFVCTGCVSVLRVYHVWEGGEFKSIVGVGEGRLT